MNSGKDIFQFADSRTYLKQTLRQLKRRPSFNLESFAKRCGFRSPSSISMFANGRRTLSPIAARKIAEALSLSRRETSYLIGLGELEAAKSAGQRLEIQAKLLELKYKTKENNLEASQFRLLSQWYYPAIYEIVGLEDFKENPAWIAQRLQNRVTADDVNKAISDLISLGLLSRKNGQLCRALSSLKTEDDIVHPALQQYHRMVLEVSQSALELPLDKREFNSVTFAVSKKHLPEVKKRIREFRDELNQFVSGDKATDEVFQLNIQLFPLTASVEGERK